MPADLCQKRDCRQKLAAKVGRVYIFILGMNVFKLASFLNSFEELRPENFAQPTLAKPCATCKASFHTHALLLLR